MRLAGEVPVKVAISAEARRALPEPTALDEGGRSDDAELTSGVLLRLPMT